MGGLTLESVDAIAKIFILIVAIGIVNRLLVLVLNKIEDVLFRFIRPYYDE